MPRKKEKQSSFRKEFEKTARALKHAYSNAFTLNPKFENVDKKKKKKKK